MTDINKFRENVYRVVSNDPVHIGAPNGAWKTREWVYEEILKNITPDMVTLETGAGVSTIFFSKSSPKKHITVVPDKNEVEKIQKHLYSLEIDGNCIDFKCCSSSLFLPTLDEKIDFALIDGCHGPIIPFIDFYFIAKNLNSNGIVIIDDIQLIAPKILFEFLKLEDSVEVVFADDWAAMLKIKDNSFIEKDWWNSGLNYTAHFDIIDSKLLDKAEKFIP